MLSQRFYIFKRYFIYKEESGVSKIKSSREDLTSMIYESFLLELSILVLALYPYCKDEI